MLASGAVYGITFGLMLLRYRSRKDARGAAILASLGGIAFFGCAVLGAMEGTRPAPKPAADPTTPAKVVVADPTPEPTPAQDPPSEPDADTPDAPAQPSEPEPVEPALPPAEALPASGPERRAAIRNVLRNARLVYEDEKDCKSAEAVGRAWRDVSALPAEAHTARVSAVVKRLEKCRRQVRWATTYVVHRDRVAARDAFEKSLGKRLKDDHGINTAIKVSGDQHERIRVGSGAIDDTLASAIMTPAFEKELGALGFELVVLASPKKTWKTRPEIRSESSYVDAELEPYGLHRKLTLQRE